jgi:NADP-reducing hydrogenase subunit HndD
MMASLIRMHGINFRDLQDEDYDSPFGISSGSGDIFAASGGVMESALRTAHFFLNGKDLRNIDFEEVRGYRMMKEAEVRCTGSTLKGSKTESRLCTGLTLYGPYSYPIIIRQ